MATPVRDPATATVGAFTYHRRARSLPDAAAWISLTGAAASAVGAEQMMNEATETWPRQNSTGHVILVFEKATRSVVFIANTAKQRDPLSFNLFDVPQGSGSGFIWNKQGHVVTNFHVVYGADAITVTLADRTEYKATMVGADPRS